MKRRQREFCEIGKFGADESRQTVPDGANSSCLREIKTAIVFPQLVDCCCLLGVDFFLFLVSPPPSSSSPSSSSLSNDKANIADTILD